MSEMQDTDQRFKLHFSDEEVVTLLNKFEQIFPNNNSILQFINALHKLGKLEQCLECKSENIDIFNDGRRIKCLDCFSQRWLTSGTYFHGTKKIHLHLIDIFLKCHHVLLSSSRFARLVGCAQSTALQILKRSAMVIQSVYEDENPEISTSFFTDVFLRRSWESPAHQHPLTEQSVVDSRLAEEAAKDAELNDKTAEADITDDTSENMKQVLAQITFDPISFDDILENLPTAGVGSISASLTMLELAGQIQRLSGDVYIRNRKIPELSTSFPLITSTTSTSFARIRWFISELYHGVSRKHFEKYIAIFWFFTFRERWGAGELLKLCASYYHIPGRRVTRSVTPSLIKIPFACMNVPDTF